MPSVAMEEAYILGCLFGRGSIKAGIRNYQLIFRVPFREYSPVATEIIKTFLKEPEGLTHKGILEIPKVKAYQPSNLGLMLNRLGKWHPPRRFAERPMVTKEEGTWKINDVELAKQFLKWQEIYHERETVGIKEYVLKHLKGATTFLATSPHYSEEVSEFGIVNHVIQCEITPHTFTVLKSTYGLEEGDIYRHARVPNAIFDFQRELLEEFVRGIADTIATIDVWLIPRIQFSVINTNYGLPIDICAILQTKLNIPVYYIGWAGKYAKRGGRDHLVKVWVVNFDKQCFNPPLFHNRRKQEEFLEHLKEAKKVLEEKGRPAWLGPCPKGRKKKGYMKICREQGCTQLPKALAEFM